MKYCNVLTTHDIDSNPVSIGRRDFFKLAVLGGGFTLLYATAPAYTGETDALLLSCMDYRLVDDLVTYMDGRGLKDKYDHIVLAGASAGAYHEKFAAWHETFWSHLQVAIDLHKIQKVIVIDHRDCGAYKIAVGAEHVKDPKSEYEAHAAILIPFAAKILEKYPTLAVEAHLMALDGSVEDVKLSSNHLDQIFNNPA
jgi:carbonic anhydrase